MAGLNQAAGADGVGTGPGPGCGSGEVVVGGVVVGVQKGGMQGSWNGGGGVVVVVVVVVGGGGGVVRGVVVKGVGLGAV